MAKARSEPISMRDAHKELTRTRLLEAAVECFSDSGYAAATVEDIAARAGSSRATFYLHFKGKSEIITDVIHEQLGRWLSIYRQLDALGPDPTPDALRQFVATLYEEARAQRRVSAVLAEAAYVDRDHLDAAWSHGATQITSTIAAYLTDRHGIEEQRARVRATLLVAQLNRFFFFNDIPQLSFDDQLVLDELTRVWTNALEHE